MQFLANGTKGLTDMAWGIPDNSLWPLEVVRAVLPDDVPHLDGAVATPCGQESGRGIKRHADHGASMEGLE